MALMTITSFMTGIKNWVLGKIGAITDLIPTEASSSNKLADKAFVNSSIATATATFRGTYNVVSDLSLSYNATHAQIQTALGSAISTADNNDYAFVQIPTADTTPTQIAKIERYKYSGSAWAFEYELNNSGFTAAQWAAINSGITGTKVTKLDALPTNAELTTLLAGKQNVIQDLATIRSGANAGSTAYQKPQGGIPKNDLSQEVQEALDNTGDVSREDLENGNIVPLYAKTLEDWADQKAIATPDTYTDAVRTTGGDIPVETSAGSKPESIKPVAGSKWTAKLLFNGSYNMLNAAKWGAANSQPYVGGVGSNFVYFLVPELTLGTFGTADENNGLLFTDSDGENVQPTSVYFKPLGATVPQSRTDGTSITPTSVSYDGNTYKDYATSGAGWLIIPKTYYDNDVCAHIAWEDWYDKHVSLDEPTTNPEAVVGVLILEGLLALAHSDKYLRGINEEVCDNAVFGETSSTITHMVDELSVAANAWTNAATGESDSQGNALYRHSATVSLIKQGGAACIEGEDGGIPLTVNGTTVSYVDTNATAPASVVFYEVTATSTTKAYTDSIFSGSNIDTETGILPINDCSIEAQVAMDGEANITVKYAKNIVDQVAINATVDVPQIKREVENHEERITELEDTAVRTGSYDASVAVGLADNFKGDTVVNAEFYKRKTGGTQSVGSGIAAIKEMRGKSIVWNQLIGERGGTSCHFSDVVVPENDNAWGTFASVNINMLSINNGHKYLVMPNFVTKSGTFTLPTTYYVYLSAGGGGSAFIVNFRIENRIFVVGNDYNGNKLSFSGTYTASANTTIDVDFALIDLTQMFGAGNEPSSVADFEKMFPLGYYDYNEGEVIPFAGQNLVTTGFNQWDEQWVEGYYSNEGRLVPSNLSLSSKNAIKIIPNTTYFISSPQKGESFFVLFLDDEKNLLNIYRNISYFTTSQDCAYILFTCEHYQDRVSPQYNNDICINISDEDRNGTYEPYEKHTLPLDPSQWRDKQGNLVFPYGGMHGVGTAYDYAKVDADGYIRKAMRVYDAIDAGDYNYTKQGNLYTTSGFIPPKANMLFGKGKGVLWNQSCKAQMNHTSECYGVTVVWNIANNTVTLNGTATGSGYHDGDFNYASFLTGEISNHVVYTKLISSDYSATVRPTPMTGGGGMVVPNGDGTGKIGVGNVNRPNLTISVIKDVTYNNVVIKVEYIDLTQMFGAGNEPATVEEFEAMFPLDYYNYDEGSLGILSNQTYADAAAFKAAMQDVPLYYELAEPVEVELATPVYAKYLVDKDGTEEITPANGSTPYTTMANLSILYAMDARGEIKNLPKNYLSKESAENMLNAMVSAGVIASYTMTWDSTNSRYVFVIQKNSEQ